MALRTAATALAPLTLANWRDAIGTWVGVAYASVEPAVQTEINRLIDEAHDFISKTMGHEPWTKRKWTETLASGTATFTLNADVRHPTKFLEEKGGKSLRGLIVTEDEWFDAWGTVRRDSHPWTDQDTPRYFYDGMDSTNPPLMQWKRVPTPDAAVTITVLGRPYFDTLATGTYTEIPAHATGQIREHLRAQFALFLGDFQKYGAHREARADQERASQVADDPTGGAEQVIEIAVPSRFISEMRQGARWGSQ